VAFNRGLHFNTKADRSTQKVRRIFYALKEINFTWILDESPSCMKGCALYLDPLELRVYILQFHRARWSTGDVRRLPY
jgi:hypothetical protein